jgi:hypothetical protein
MSRAVADDLSAHRALARRIQVERMPMTDDVAAANSRTHAQASLDGHGAAALEAARSAYRDGQQPLGVAGIAARLQSRSGAHFLGTVIEFKTNRRRFGAARVMPFEALSYSNLELA